MGFDYVFDTNFSADLTIMEEGTEFLRRMKEKDQHKFPMFTSCCPGWVRFLKSQYPDMVDQLSTAKSPQQMFGAVAKTYFAKKIGVDPEKITSVSIMPCLAKKQECDLPNINDAGAGKDVDYVLTTREICRMIRADQIDLTHLPEEEFDSPLGTGSGSRGHFGATGGVMEAALRTCYALVNGENPPADAFSQVRGTRGWKEADFDLGGQTIHTAVVSGLGNTRRLIRAVRRGEVQYDFVEVMACRAVVPAAAGNRSTTVANWQANEVRCCISTMPKIPCVSLMKTPKSKCCMKTFWANPTRNWRTIYCIQTIMAGICRRHPGMMKMSK